MVCHIMPVCIFHFQLQPFDEFLNRLVFVSSLFNVSRQLFNFIRKSIANLHIKYLHKAVIWFESESHLTCSRFMHSLDSEIQIACIEILIFLNIGRTESFRIGFRNISLLVIFIRLPENDADLVIRKILFGEHLDVLIFIAVRPAIAVPFFHPCTVFIKNPVALVAERFRFFVKLLAAINNHDAALV